MISFFCFEIVNIFLDEILGFLHTLERKLNFFLLTNENNKNHNIHILFFLASRFKEFRYLILYITVYTELV